jgi:hypothetical protein
MSSAFSFLDSMQLLPVSGFQKQGIGLGWAGKFMMRTFSKCFFGAAAGLLAAPLIGWSVAVMLSRFGVTRFVLESPFGGVLTLSCKEGIPGVPLQLGGGVAVVVGIFISYLLVRLNLRWSKGWQVTGATLLCCAGCYTWLMWDGPMPKPIPMEKLLPHPGVVCMPREQVFEACMDNPFSKVADWPVRLIELKDAECSMSWAREHETEIRANWEKLKPVREWIDRVNRFEAFDDYVDDFSKPILRFQPLRQFAWSSRKETPLWQLSISVKCSRFPTACSKEAVVWLLL